MSLRTGKIKVLIVDDALLMRRVIRDMLEQDSQFEVVGEAPNGREALKQVAVLNPDAITLDVEMPIMDGIQFLKAQKEIKTIPTIMVSSITYEGGMRTIEALENGAFDFIQKPKAQAAHALNTVKMELIAKLKAAISSPLLSNRLLRQKRVASTTSSSAIATKPDKLKRVSSFDNHVIAIGISTGGPPCVTKILETMPKNCPPILVVQHMPEGFTKPMADRINARSLIEVKEAKTGDVLKAGVAYIAPGGQHLGLLKEVSKKVIVLSKKPPVSGHRPSVDFMFDSLAKVYAEKTIAVLMTGMGKDGAIGMARLYNQGAHTIAQDEQSCTVFGMPKAAIKDQVVDEILSLDGIVLRLKKLTC